MGLARQWGSELQAAARWLGLSEEYVSRSDGVRTPTPGGSLFIAIAALVLVLTQALGFVVGFTWQSVLLVLFGALLLVRYTRSYRFLRRAN